MRDKHHILHSRQEWRLRSESRQLREHPSLVPTIDRELHNEIHRECPPVPLLGYHALRSTLELWTPRRDTLQSIDNLLFAISETNRHPRAHPIERELGMLAMEAIELQKPFIRSGVEHRLVLT